MINESNNRKYRTYLKKSGQSDRDVSYADFCEIQNRYASERINKEDVSKASRFMNDNGSEGQAAMPHEPQPQPNDNPKPEVVHAEEEEDKILGMPRKVAIGVFILIAVLLLAGGVVWYRSRNKSVMPGVGKSADAPSPSAGAKSDTGAGDGSATAGVA